MQVYREMFGDVINYGTHKENRTGVDTISTFGFYYELCWDPAMGFDGSQHRHHLLPQNQMGFDESHERQYAHPTEPGAIVMPLLTTKSISWKNIVVELLWFLSGDTHIEFLRRHGCKFWDPWADEDGNVPSAYGHFWRRYPTFNKRWDGYVKEIDQLAWVLKELREHPMNRRLVISAWEPSNASTSKLPPCHFAMAFNVQLSRQGQPRLCLHLTQRSCDLALGVPYNMASYGLLLAVMSHLSGIKPGIFAHTLLDLHVYTKKPDGSMAEYDQVPGLTKQCGRLLRALPYVVIDPAIKELSDIEALLRPEVSTEQLLAAFKLGGYDPHPAVPFKVVV